MLLSCSVLICWLLEQNKLRICLGCVSVQSKRDFFFLSSVFVVVWKR